MSSATPPAIIDVLHRTIKQLEEENDTLLDRLRDTTRALEFAERKAKAFKDWDEAEFALVAETIAKSRNVLAS